MLTIDELGKDLLVFFILFLHFLFKFKIILMKLFKYKNTLKWLVIFKCKCITAEKFLNDN